MARPKKKEEDKRLKVVKIRFTEAEFQKLSDGANEIGKTVSDHVRGVMLNTLPLKRPVTPSRQINLKGLAELGKIGVNLNQLQREINVKNKFPDLGRIDPDLINEALHGIKTLTYFLINELENGD
jgi:hypothetical protein